MSEETARKDSFKYLESIMDEKGIMDCRTQELNGLFEGVHFRLDIESIITLNFIAKKEDRTLSYIIRKILQEYIKKNCRSDQEIMYNFCYCYKHDPKKLEKFYK
jgi:hypothetical protein